MSRDTIGEKFAKGSILDAVKPLEPAIIQGAGGRSPYIFKDPYQPLQFVHFSDNHGLMDSWNRTLTFADHYQKYLSFVLHTGDGSGTSADFVDMYERCVPCGIPVMNCTGNHDRAGAVDTPERTAKELVWSHLFTTGDSWGVNFMDCDFPMAYYKDFPESNVRLIVLDLYFDLDKQCEWLRGLLAEAMEKGLHVFTATHQPTDTLVDFPETTFTTAMDWSQVAPGYQGDAPIVYTPFEDPIADFVEAGGNYICHLSGHHHRPYFGYTKRGVLNLSVAASNDWSNWNDSKRVFDSEAYDCFNVVSVDTNTNLLRVIHIGNDLDYYLRRQTLLSFDYKEKKVIFNG